MTRRLLSVLCCNCSLDSIFMSSSSLTSLLKFLLSIIAFLLHEPSKIWSGLCFWILFDICSGHRTHMLIDYHRHERVIIYWYFIFLIYLGSVLFLLLNRCVSVCVSRFLNTSLVTAGSIVKFGFLWVCSVGQTESSTISRCSSMFIFATKLISNYGVFSF